MNDYRYYLSFCGSHEGALDELVKVVNAYAKAGDRCVSVTSDGKGGYIALMETVASRSLSDNSEAVRAIDQGNTGLPENVSTDSTGIPLHVKAMNLVELIDNVLVKISSPDYVPLTQAIKDAIDGFNTMRSAGISFVSATNMVMGRGARSSRTSDHSWTVQVKTVSTNGNVYLSFSPMGPPSVYDLQLSIGGKGSYGEIVQLLSILYLALTTEVSTKDLVNSVDEDALKRLLDNGG